jgi:hypothetical protein
MGLPGLTLPTEIKQLKVNNLAISRRIATANGTLNIARSHQLMQNPCDIPQTSGTERGPGHVPPGARTARAECAIPGDLVRPGTHNDPRGDRSNERSVLQVASTKSFAAANPFPESGRRILRNG